MTGDTTSAFSMTCLFRRKHRGVERRMWLNGRLDAVEAVTPLALSHPIQDLGSETPASQGRASDLYREGIASLTARSTSARGILDRLNTSHSC